MVEKTASIIWPLLAATATALAELSIFLIVYWRPEMPTAVGSVMVRAPAAALQVRMLSAPVKV
jgi:hypothetical protein